MTQSSRPKATCKTLLEKKNTCKNAKFMRYCMLLFVTICVVIVVVNVVVGINKNSKSRTSAGLIFWFCVPNVRKIEKKFNFKQLGKHIQDMRVICDKLLLILFHKTGQTSYAGLTHRSMFLENFSAHTNPQCFSPDMIVWRSHNIFILKKQVKHSEVLQKHICCQNILRNCMS